MIGRQATFFIPMSWNQIKKNISSILSTLTLVNPAVIIHNRLSKTLNCIKYLKLLLHINIQYMFYKTQYLTNSNILKRSIIIRDWNNYKIGAFLLIEHLLGKKKKLNKIIQNHKE